MGEVIGPLRKQVPFSSEGTHFLFSLPNYCLKHRTLSQTEGVGIVFPRVFAALGYLKILPSWEKNLHSARLRRRRATGRKAGGGHTFSSGTSNWPRSIDATESPASD